VKVPSYVIVNEFGDYWDHHHKRFRGPLYATIFPNEHVAMDVIENELTDNSIIFVTIRKIYK